MLPLHQVLEHGDEPAVAALLAAGADPDQPDGTKERSSASAA